jgi:hypothetical protein
MLVCNVKTCGENVPVLVYTKLDAFDNYITPAPIVVRGWVNVERIVTG